MLLANGRRNRKPSQNCDGMDEGCAYDKFFREPELSALDDAAYRASRADQYGDDGDWFLTFRMAINGARSRLDGANVAYRALTEWTPGLPQMNHEQNLAVCLFSMDSAIECWAFGLNAFGFGLLPDAFFDVKDATKIKLVNPTCIFNPGIPGNKNTATGFEEVFRRVTQLWRSHEQELKIILANHDVSKHRYSNLTGATYRSDPPPELLRQAGLRTADDLTLWQTPMTDIRLRLEPKMVYDSTPLPVSAFANLLTLKPHFDEVLNRTPLLAKEDVDEFVSLHPPVNGRAS